MVKAVMIVEIMGRPAEHVREKIEEHMGFLDKRKEINVISKEFSDPAVVAPAKEGDKPTDLFTCFSEVEFECETLKEVGDVVFDFMPSSIEIIEPAQVHFESHDATDLLNNLTGRIHRYDEIAKMAQGKINQLTQQLQIAGKALHDNGLLDKEGRLIIKKPEDKKPEKKVHVKKSAKKVSKKK
jgi:hypothetical protein